MRIVDGEEVSGVYYINFAGGFFFVTDSSVDHGAALVGARPRERRLAFVESDTAE